VYYTFLIKWSNFKNSQYFSSIELKTETGFFDGEFGPWSSQHESTASPQDIIHVHMPS